MHILSDHSDGSDVGIDGKLHLMQLRRNTDVELAFRRKWEFLLRGARVAPAPISLGDIGNPNVMYTIFQKELIHLIRTLAEGA